MYANYIKNQSKKEVQKKQRKKLETTININEISSKFHTTIRHVAPNKLNGV